MCLKWWWKNTKTKYENKFHSFLPETIFLSKTNYSCIEKEEEEFVNSFRVDDYSWRSVIAFCMRSTQGFCFCPIPIQKLHTRCTKNVEALEQKMWNLCICIFCKDDRWLDLILRGGLCVFCAHFCILNELAFLHRLLLFK